MNAARRAHMVTVAICLHNRFEYLDEALDGLEAQTMQQSRFRVLLVDNSTDAATSAAFFRRRKLAPNVSVIMSSPPGLSRARNKALEECESDVIVYLDDDAVPGQEWLRSIERCFRADPGVAFVGGRIDPIWKSERPYWLGPRFEGCLSILDLGDEERELAKHEYGYGANIAFRASWLRRIGGFDEQIGRIGSNTLLSAEEASAQDKIRALGGRGWYAPDASVGHVVPTERLQKSWFMSRMAWQAVSELLQDPPAAYPNWSKTEILRLSRELKVLPAIGGLLFSTTPSEFDAKLELIKHLVTYLLAGKNVADREFFQGIPEGVGLEETQDNSVDSDAVEPCEDYLPSAAIAPRTKHVFFECVPGHSYLFDIFGQIPGTQLVTTTADIWSGNLSPSLAYVERSMTSSVKSLVFLTACSFVHPTQHQVFLDFVKRQRVPVYGFLHRYPATPEEAANFRQLSRHMAGIFVMSEKLARQLQTVHEAANVHYVPHPPVNMVSYTGLEPGDRNAIGARDGQVVFSLLGELRKGKGIELFLDALGFLPADVRERVFVLVAGNGRDFTGAHITAQLNKHWVAGRVDVREAADYRNFAVLTKREFAKYVLATDVGVLLYQDSQRYVASATLAEFVWARRRVLVNELSASGGLVRRHKLGVVVGRETPEAVADGIIETIAAIDDGMFAADQFDAVRRTLCSDAVNKALAALLPDAEFVS